MPSDKSALVLSKPQIGVDNFEKSITFILNLPLLTPCAIVAWTGSQMHQTLVETIQLIGDACPNDGESVGQENGKWNGNLDYIGGCRVDTKNPA